MLQFNPLITCLWTNSTRPSSHERIWIRPTHSNNYNKKKENIQFLYKTESRNLTDSTLLCCTLFEEKPLWLWGLTLHLTPLTCCTFPCSYLRALSLSAKYFRLNRKSLGQLSRQTFPLGVTHPALLQHQGKLRLCKVAAVVLCRVEHVPAYLWATWFIEVFCWCCSTDGLDFQELCCTVHTKGHCLRQTHTHTDTHMQLQPLWKMCSTLFVKAVRQLTQRAEEVPESSPNGKWGGEKQELVR